MVFYKNFCKIHEKHPPDSSLIRNFSIIAHLTMESPHGQTAYKRNRAVTEREARETALDKMDIERNGALHKITNGALNSRAKTAGIHVKSDDTPGMLIFL
ncbi:MAG: hypothetical protein Ct9H300mP28_07820 [Pseudomonadota bacterium]|nr:MAG: hypothetical protein Ct9H300mP28_07820 [Pseudomonadota bacterium]